MHGARATYPTMAVQVGSDLPLDVKVPVQDVGTLGILLDYTDFLTPFGEKPTLLSMPLPRVTPEQGLAAQLPAADVPPGLSWSDDLERRSRGSIQAKLIGKGQHIEDSEAPSYGRLSFLNGSRRNQCAVRSSWS